MKIRQIITEAERRTSLDPVVRDEISGIVVLFSKCARQDYTYVLGLRVSDPADKRQKVLEQFIKELGQYRQKKSGSIIRFWW